MKKLNKKGFTIVELVIVISVIAILSAVMVPTFSNVIKNSKDSAALQSARNAYTAYTMECAKADDEAETNLIYKGENGRWVVIKDGQVSKTVCASEDEAKEKLGLEDDDNGTPNDKTDDTAKNYEKEVITENLTAYKIAVAEEGEGA